MILLAEHLRAWKALWGILSSFDPLRGESQVNYYHCYVLSSMDDETKPEVLGISGPRWVGSRARWSGSHPWFTACSILLLCLLTQCKEKNVAHYSNSTRIKPLATSVIAP